MLKLYKVDIVIINITVWLLYRVHPLLIIILCLWDLGPTFRSGGGFLLGTSGVAGLSMRVDLGGAEVPIEILNPVNSTPYSLSTARTISRMYIHIAGGP